jgi:uncharacterized protein YndB with AHSA1/START domain
VDDDLTADHAAYRVETEFDADPSRVWRALTEPDAMGEWLGRPVEFTLEQGAEGTIGSSAEGTIGSSAEGTIGGGDDDATGPTVLVVEEVDEERRLVFRWASATEAPTVVEIDLRPIGRRTHLTIVERPLRTGHVSDTTARACVLALAA